MITKQEFKNHIINDTLTLDIVKEWVENGGDINIQDKWGSTALMWASYNGHLEVVQYLVENGADINIQNNWGDTALIWASSKGYLDIVKVLVDKGVKIDQQNIDGKTALYFQRKNIEGIKHFLQSKQYSNKIKGLKRKNISFKGFINCYGW